MPRFDSRAKLKSRLGCANLSHRAAATGIPAPFSKDSSQEGYVTQAAANETPTSHREPPLGPTITFCIIVSSICAANFLHRTLCEFLDAASTDRLIPVSRLSLRFLIAQACFRFCRPGSYNTHSPRPDRRQSSVSKHLFYLVILPAASCQLPTANTAGAFAQQACPSKTPCLLVATCRHRLHPSESSSSSGDTWPCDNSTTLLLVYLSLVLERIARHSI
ncbi:hypothetical protein LMH87_011634 [Akanthomyces muscarius]|uniref:Uncharacterized protein n=1 Tax=Akanthomyces muscarius TaxID=2231603 RepID=A0A9W8UL70_AKAMU|nr:hypothetical protein LMH87_011634 [Akanthomyces muscarius]KAJ4150906.1 hypothetical protein LMH87_011634 [Akanthomyces muscarius]